MADMKTHLRELSVAVTVGLLSKKITFDPWDLYNSATFYHYGETVISNDISSARNILEESRYVGECAQIIDNGYKLGLAIYENPHFQIGKEGEILWLGNDTQKGNPIDIQIGEYPFSLKEDSFILKNMGLYELLNSMTGSHFRRGLHVFSHFAPAEYDAWFAYTWEKFASQVSRQPWCCQNDEKSRAYHSKDHIILQYDGVSSKVPCGISTNAQFMKYTSAKTREKVFSKWIHEVISTDWTYLYLKKHCAETAGEQIRQLISGHYNPASVHRFFQIYPYEYYYAKTTAKETTILKVPSLASFPGTICLKECRVEVPSSQLNIISVFENTKTGKTLEFRNECRFSHGQFNGTPEAKMYVKKNTSLTELYEPVR